MSFTFAIFHTMAWAGLKVHQLFQKWEFSLQGFNQLGSGFENGLCYLTELKDFSQTKSQQWISFCYHAVRYYYSIETHKTARLVRSWVYWPDAQITDIRPAVQCKFWSLLFWLGKSKMPEKGLCCSLGSLLEWCSARIHVIYPWYGERVSEKEATDTERWKLKPRHE